MSQIRIDAGEIEIDAGLVAAGLKIDPEHLKRGMRDGRITSRSERGEGADAGRIRLTFRSADRRLRIIATEAGEVLFSSAVDTRGAPEKP